MIFEAGEKGVVSLSVQLKCVQEVKLLDVHVSANNKLVGVDCATLNAKIGKQSLVNGQGDNG